VRPQQKLKFDDCQHQRKRVDARHGKLSLAIIKAYRTYARKHSDNSSTLDSPLLWTPKCPSGPMETMSKSLPDPLLLAFFTQAKTELQNCKVSGASRMAEIRAVLLANQSACLGTVLNQYNRQNGTSFTVDQIQAQLKSLRAETVSLQVKLKLDEMNETARLAFCRLVLYSESSQHQDRSLRDQMQLEASQPMQRDEIMEFCALCNTALRLPNVRLHLEKGKSLFDDGEFPPVPIDPPKRIELIQRMFFRALGYDPDHGMAEIERIFFSERSSEFGDDKELMAVFADMLSKTKVVVTNATLIATEAAFSDHDDGGCTRVVSVQYSEKVIDSLTGQYVDEAERIAPSSLAMEQQTESQQRQQLRVASQAAALQQELLGQLLSMPDEEREERMSLAKEASDEFTRKILAISPGPDRIVFLQSVDERTQKELAMLKLWENMLASNEGKPPTIRKELDTRAH
jgi:hypothetical protein